jgi:hypothetical protein
MYDKFSFFTFYYLILTRKVRFMVSSIHRTYICMISFTLLLSFGFPVKSMAQIPIPDSSLQLSLENFLQKHINNDFFVHLSGYNKRDSTRIDSFTLSEKKKELSIYFDKSLAYAPIRQTTISVLEDSLFACLDGYFVDYKIIMYSGSRLLNEYIPNFYRPADIKSDQYRLPEKIGKNSKVLVEKLSVPYDIHTSLFNYNIALWPSHGWYYEPTLKRWEWQRARLFRTVEDLFPMQVTTQFLMPMLENAGAGVFIPRERDWQINEVIVDNDSSAHSSHIQLLNDQYLASAAGTGFAIGNPPYTNENPFKLGTYLNFNTEKVERNYIEWIPNIPEDGFYPVYISYHSFPKSCENAIYTVYHSGGQTKFAVNQTMGGGTWVYLGRFQFKKGSHPKQGKVLLSSLAGPKNRIITADAVRFGGGMGNISREGQISHRSRYQEASRYYLQYAGFPDSLVWNFPSDMEDDYRDDLNGHGEWVNYLSSSPVGPDNITDYQGLNIPIDLAFAFHTDAGVAHGDTIIGTLGIYSTEKDKGRFYSGQSKMASRDLTDIIQTEVIEDVRALYNQNWTRRAMWDRGYSEAFRPDVPTMLLELFSHQNLNDVLLAHEPEFQFNISRAIYKGMLKYLASSFGFEYTVQPLPVTHFQAALNEGREIHLKWKAVSDSLEPTAEASQFVVYTRINDGGFDNGILVNNNFLSLKDVQEDSIYSFKVAALNKGGISFPSEILSVCKTKNSSSTVLIINAFDRTGGAAYFSDSLYSGFLDNVDRGVPYMEDRYTTGYQYDFDRSSPWLDDDSPGHGASYADLETLIIPGNNFDFSSVHGKSIRNAGFSFVSVSDEAFSDSGFNINSYEILDILAGEEKISFIPGSDSVMRFQLFPKDFLAKLEEFTDNGGNVFISGSEIASDMHNCQQDSAVGNVLNYEWRTGNASRKGEFCFTNKEFFSGNEIFQFNTGIDSEIYTVESADALEPFDKNSASLLRYTENNMSAGVIYQGKYKVIAFGFPFETITDQKDRDIIMKKILEFLNKK